MCIAAPCEWGSVAGPSRLGQILLNEAGTQVYIDLHQGRVANTAEAMDLPGFDDENVTRPGFEFLAIDRPEAPPFPDELDFVIRMPMRPWTATGECAEEECGDVDVAVLGTDEW